MPSSRGEPPRHPHGLAVGDHLEAVHDGRVVGLGPEVLTHPFGEVGANIGFRGSGVDGALGVHANDENLWVLFLQVPTRAADRATGSDARREDPDRAVGLAPDLRTGRLVLGLRVGRVRVLVGAIGPRDLFGQPIGHRVVGPGIVGTDVGGADDHLGPVRPQEVLFLLRLLVGHDRHQLVPLQRGSHGQADARVPRRRLDDRASRFEPSVLLGSLDHAEADPILDRAPRIHGLDLGNQVPGRMESAKTDQRRVADSVHDRLAYVHGARLARSALDGTTVIVERPSVSPS